MLRYVRRGSGNAEPIGDLPVWLSTLLRNRGVDTPEKAERFLHPSLDQLHDPFLMLGMEKAVRLIRQAIEARDPMVIYGDYDVDGMCATSILLETLRELGAEVDFRIPSRHGEGYGLNEAAVREMAERHRLLITVDCGVTNHEEVRLAQLLGMTVIVTDHHQLADTPSPADVTLNPLLGAYPFRRLCGAGVALKLTQALSGMEAVQKRLDLAALATVADIVPLTDENRVIVREGLLRIAETERPGLQWLMRLSSVKPPVNAGQVGFRLAPRLNAAGRLEDAAQGVTLLTTRDEDVAQRIAGHLEENNQRRQALEQDITRQALERIPETVDFRDDLVIIVMGEDWNPGVIGLAAGRICEKYHFPTIVLSRQGETAVGSCRSIPGVNIHGMLTTCKDLFQRFGGHEQAAGLTMDASLVPELRRRLNLAIRENCDPACYIPAKEYDLALPLSAVTLELIDALSALQPAGYGNPNPVLLTTRCHVQQARRVGKQREHLKLTLLEGAALRSGIGFSLGDLAEEAFDEADVLYAPERNVFQGEVTAQLQVQAMKPAEGSTALPGDEALFRALLQEITALASNSLQIPVSVPTVPTVTAAAVKRLLASGRGTLLIGHERSRLAAMAQSGPCDVAFRRMRDARGFNTALLTPDLTALRDVWRDVVLLDGEVLPGEVERIREHCPRAELCTLTPNPAFLALIEALAMGDEALRGLYRRIRRGGSMVASSLAADCGLSIGQVLTGLQAFQEVRLVEFSLEPYAVRLLPPVKCRMDDSPTLRYIRKVAGKPLQV